MASPHHGQPSYPQPSQAQSQSQISQDQPPHDAPAPSAGGRKKRHYAGQAYEFGAGGNAAIGGQQPQPGVVYPPPQGAAYPGYGQQPHQTLQTQPYPAGPVSPAGDGARAYGQPAAPLAGYQSSDVGYPGPGVPSPQPGIGAVTGDMSRMSLTGPGQHQASSRPVMNQLYPTDLLNTNLDVAELDYPPPPINLPPNVRLLSLP